MEGDLREFTLAEILQFISLGSRTGVLEILRRDGVFRINFTGGMITGLTGDGWSLAQELRDSDLLPPEVLSNLLTSNANSHDLRGEVLTGEYMTVEEWTAFVARQVERLLYTLFDVTEGTFRFRQASTHPGPWLAVRISADRAVLEGTRWSETWQRAAARVPSRQSRFERTNQIPAAPLKVSPTQWRVFVATEAPANVLQIAARAVLSEVEVVESLQFLVERGLLRIDSERD